MREMRRQDRKLDPEGIMEILNMGEYGVLATVMDICAIISGILFGTMPLMAKHEL